MHESDAGPVIAVVFASLLEELAPAKDDVVYVVVRRAVHGGEVMDDPSPEVLARLQQLHAAVQVGSLRESGRPVLDIGPVQILDAESARTGAGYSLGRYHTRESMYELARVDGEWRITKKKLTAII